MKIALIQISDIHLTENAVANPVLQRGDAIAAAVASVCHGIPHGILVVSGDTAYSGKKAEYQHGQLLIEGIRAKLSPSFGGAAVRVLTIAGNHDCDFELATSVREIVIGAIKPDRIDDAVIAQCVGPQKHYATFAQQLDSPAPGALTTGLDRLYRQTVVEAGEKRVVFHLLNSAWVSQLHEKPGTLFFPIRLIKERILAAPSAELVVSVVHHPFNWYAPENSRELRQCLEDNSDIILTGHEHIPGSYAKKTDVGEQNEYLEGGVLQESGQPDISSFNVVLFDVAQGQQQTYRFVWDGKRYAPEGEPYWRPLERNKRLTRNQFEFTEQFFHLLEDPGAGYTHPHKDPINLSDLFVYPDLQETQYQQEGPDRPLIRSRQVVTYVLNNPRVLIVAEEKAGKTSVAKSLVKDLHHNGKIPVLLDGEVIGKYLDADKLRKAVGVQVDEQYGDGHRDQFWQMDADKRVAVVDDFHKTGGNRKHKDLLINLLCERFGHVVLLTGEGIRLEELSSPSATHSPLWEFKQCNVLEFGHVLRHMLVSKWFRIVLLSDLWEGEVINLEETIGCVSCTKKTRNLQ